MEIQKKFNEMIGLKFGELSSVKYVVVNSVSRNGVTLSINIETDGIGGEWHIIDLNFKEVDGLTAQKSYMKETLEWINEEIEVDEYPDKIDEKYIKNEIMKFADGE